ncbi:MAG TPA: NAD+ synthase [Vicinamibacterales bacterium]|jgi:NAD+ synthetase|nr:NAD+ synthase [Vicinamibacterales bacterium]
MRLALAQLNFTVGAFDANFERMRAAIERARAAGADLVVFSELAATGYPPHDLLTHESFVDRNLEVVERLARLSSGSLAILVGFVDRNRSGQGKPLYNAAALCQSGRVTSRQYKSLLPTYDVFDEDRYFEPATDVAPMDVAGRRVGVTICEDVWNDRDFWPRRRYHRDPVSEQVAAGADLLLNISASPFTLEKVDLRRRMIHQDAVKHGRPFFYLNQVGGNDDLIFDGHSIGFGPDGREILRAASFDEDFLVIDVPDAGEMNETEHGGRLRPAPASEEESAYRALVLGLRDYVRKCGFSDAVLGLSGGIDSALTACLAADALGPAHVHGVSMPARYSSDHSLADAKSLAEALGIGYDVVPIDPIFQSYLDGLDARLVSGTRSMTEENLQARVRGAVLMALSNNRGALLLTTGNKSELAVGYCTLYGDMCGGLAVISDVPKLLVYRLARFVNRDRVIIPESTLTKPPSAELRPDQKDSDSLPPYEILDPIIAAYVEQGLEAPAIAALGFDPAVVADVIRRIDASEFKRRQAAPGLKISSKAFGTGRRYPIAAKYR